MSLVTKGDTGGVMRNKLLQEMEQYATIVHTALAVLHFGGIAYNWNRKNYKTVILHFAVGVFDLQSALQHGKRLR